MTTPRDAIAGKEIYTVHDPFLNKKIEISNKLMDRLRGKYANGPTLPDGEPEFGWSQFETPPIQHEAADAIDALQARVKELEGLFAQQNELLASQAQQIQTARTIYDAANARATRLQQERDEAYERAAQEAEGPLFAGKCRGSEGHNWWHEKQPYGYEHDYGNGRHDAAAAIRRLAGPEKIAAANDGDDSPRQEKI